MSSFENQPDSGANPASASAPTVKVANVNGIALRKPPMRSMFWMPAMAPITDPAAMNRRALKKACVIRWNRPPSYPPVETPRIM